MTSSFLGLVHHHDNEWKVCFFRGVEINKQCTQRSVGTVKESCKGPIGSVQGSSEVEGNLIKYGGGAFVCIACRSRQPEKTYFPLLRSCFCSISTLHFLLPPHFLNENLIIGLLLFKCSVTMCLKNVCASANVFP